MLLYGGHGEGTAQTADLDEGTVVLGANDTVIRRHKPWQWALSGYACAPADSRWIQDRQNLVDIYHDQLGLIVGGGNTKLQPYWSTFTVGDPSLLAHKPGDESPDFTPDIPLAWTPTSASVAGDGSTMSLNCGDAECRVSVSIAEDGALMLTYTAPSGKKVEAHVPFMNRADVIQTAANKEITLAEAPFVLTGPEIGGSFTFGDLLVTVPEAASLRWPAKQHDPYKKDGSSSLSAAKLVLVLPFETVEACVVKVNQVVK